MARVGEILEARLVNRRELIKTLAAGAAIAAGLNIPQNLEPVIIAASPTADFWWLHEATYPRWQQQRECQALTEEKVEEWIKIFNEENAPFAHISSTTFPINKRA